MREGDVVQVTIEFLHVSFVGFAHVQTPQFARGNVFATQPTQQQLLEQDKYKAYLKHQVLLRPLGDGWCLYLVLQAARFEHRLCWQLTVEMLLAAPRLAPLN